MKAKVTYKLDTARWQFFGYNPIGKKILDVADLLHARFPKNKAVEKIWLFCLPF